MEVISTARQLEPLVGAVEAAEYLGFAPLTIRRMARRGILPSIAFPMGDTGKYMHKFRMSDLEAYVKTLEHKMIVPKPKDVSVLPFIDGICRLNDYELFYGKYIDGAGFNKWIERFRKILQAADRRIILYIAGHGSNRTLGGKKLNTLLAQVFDAANHHNNIDGHLNIEGCILGGCFIGENLEEMKVWMTASKLTWMVGYKHQVDWLPSTLMDMSIISQALACDEDDLKQRDALESFLIDAASFFNPNRNISTDKRGSKQNFHNTLTCVIQPRTQGTRPVSIQLI